MSKKVMVVGRILVLVIIAFSLLKIPFTSEFDVSNENQGPIVTTEKSTLKKVIEKLHEKYVGVDVKATSNKELLIQVVGDEPYIHSVKEDMESIVKSAIQNSILKDYVVVFERWELIGDMNKMSELEFRMLHTLTDGLKDYQVVKHISTDSQQTNITIHTLIEGSDTNAQKEANEIEQKVNEILNSKELISVANIDTYRIQIVNIEGIKINS